MIARGDLAVECGFERMAEVQEEILWICEAHQSKKRAMLRTLHVAHAASLDLSTPPMHAS
jgi:hypothetical protein